MSETALSHRRFLGNWRTIRPPARRPRPRPGAGRSSRRPAGAPRHRAPDRSPRRPLRPRHRCRLAADRVARARNRGGATWSTTRASAHRALSWTTIPTEMPRRCGSTARRSSPSDHASCRRMVERGRGGIINVASSAGMQPIPYESVYSATKAFVISFTDALHTELRGSGVRVLAVNPGRCRPSSRNARDTNRGEWASSRPHLRRGGRPRGTCSG